uniref:Chromo domain-containing protein n=1 Tax=Rhabditophanes sp. KR3021 TaxID=114890 RepID=A0AC35TN38_9BILA
MSEFDVEKILDKRVFHVKGKKIEKYHVLWLGYPLSEATWEPVANMRYTNVVAIEYEARLAKEKKELEERINTSHSTSPPNSIDENESLDDEESSSDDNKSFSPEANMSNYSDFMVYQTPGLTPALINSKDKGPIKEIRERIEIFGNIFYTVGYEDGSGAFFNERDILGENEKILNRYLGNQQYPNALIGQQK